MSDIALAIANLEVRISILRREERQWLTILGDDSQTKKVQAKAREELHRVMSAIIAAVATVKKLETDA